MQYIIAGLFFGGIIVWFMWPEIKGLWRDWVEWPFEQ